MEHPKTKVTYEDLANRGLYYHPKEIGMPTDYYATIPEFINEYRDKMKSKGDIILVICNNNYMMYRPLRLFAVWCAREALKLVENPDQRSVKACDVAEAWANGNATQEELAAAYVAAKDAAKDAARAADYATGGSAAYVPAQAGRAAARAADWNAESDAVRDAFGDAKYIAARDAVYAANLDAAWDAQIDHLLTYFNS